MIYVSFAAALRIADRLGFVVVEPGLLASALARPATILFHEEAYPGLPEKAAALMHSLARNHALLDGNKRTAWVLTATFVALNGLDLAAGAEDAEAFVVDVAQGFVALEDMAKWIADHIG